MEDRLALDPIETDTKRATARLPGLEIEIVHRRPHDGFEQLSISLQATPSFEAFGRLLETANPFVFWSRVAEMAWLSWSGVANAMMQPWSTPWTAWPPRLQAPGAPGRADDAERR